MMPTLPGTRNVILINRQLVITLLLHFNAVSTPFTIMSSRFLLSSTLSTRAGFIWIYIYKVKMMIRCVYKKKKRIKSGGRWWKRPVWVRWTQRGVPVHVDASPHGAPNKQHKRNRHRPVRSWKKWGPFSETAEMSFVLLKKKSGRRRNITF